jgi:hypothetical protein
MISDVRGYGVSTLAPQRGSAVKSGGGSTLLKGLVAYWKFDTLAGGTTAVDATGNGNDLDTLHNGNCNNAGIIGNGFQASSSDGYIKGTAAGTEMTTADSWTTVGWIGNIVAGFTGTNNFFWGRFAHTGDTDYRIGWVIGQGFQIFSTDSGATQHFVGEGTLSIPQFTWWQIAAGFDLATQTLWISKNAGPRTTVSQPNQRNNVQTTFSIANPGDAVITAAPCVIDELAVYKRTLKPTEVLKLYNNGTALPFAKFKG